MRISGDSDVIEDIAANADRVGHRWLHGFSLTLPSASSEMRHLRTASEQMLTPRHAGDEPAPDLHELENTSLSHSFSPARRDRLSPYGCADSDISPSSRSAMCARRRQAGEPTRFMLETDELPS